MVSLLKNRQLMWLLVVAAIYFFLGNNWVSLTDPDEVFYSLTAKEMLLRHDWMTPYIFGYPQFEKPIMTYWLILSAYKIWGVTPWAARFFPALFAFLAVIATYFLTLLIYRDKNRAFLAGFILATSAFFIGMGKTVFTDMIFATFILYALLSFYIGYVEPRLTKLAWIGFYVCAGLATLTKGPLGWAIPQLTVILFLWYKQRLLLLRTPMIIIGIILMLIIAGPWYWQMYQMYGHAFIQEFFYNDHWHRLIEAEHRSNDRWFFYPLAMIYGLFPFSLFVVASFKQLYHRLANPNEGNADYFILAWLLVVFIIFQSAHSKLVSYILPLFPALAILTADYLARGISKRLLITTSVIIGVIGIAAFIAPQVLAKKMVIPVYPVYWVSGGLIALAGIAYSCAVADKPKASLYIISSTIMVVLIGAWLLRPFIEEMASCAPAAEYLPSTIGSKDRVLTSKPYARGMYFYTGHEVAVYDPGGRGYFSPHPIPSFSTDAQLEIFLNTQPVTYAYLKRSGYEHLAKEYKDKYTITVLKTFGTNRLVKIEQIVKS